MFLPQSYTGIKPSFGMPINFSHHLAQGRVGYWLFNEGCGGKVFDSFLNGNIGTINGATWVLGPNGWVLDFNDVASNYVSIADSDDFSFTDGNDTPFTIAILVNLDDNANAGIISKYGTAGNREWYLTTNAVGKLYVTLLDTDGDSIGRRYISSALSIGVWYYIVITYSGNELNSGLKLYVNGVRVDDQDFGSGTYNGMTNGNSPVKFGALATSYINGRIGEVVIWNRDLLDTEILQFYFNPYIMFEVPVNPAIFGLPVAPGLSILDFERAVFRGANRGVMRGVM